MREPMSQETEGKYWFGFRQTYPQPPGKGISCGPYNSYGEAKLERAKAKAWDCSVSVPFFAKTREEAEEKAEKWI
jgi:hypothetical protein